MTKKEKKIPEKKWFDVKIEAMLPATLTYRVLAEDPQEAIKLIKNMSPVGVKHKLIGRKELKIMVYDAGTTFLKFMQNLIGR